MTVLSTTIGFETLEVKVSFTEETLELISPSILTLIRVPDGRRYTESRCALAAWKFAKIRKRIAKTLVLRATKFIQPPSSWTLRRHPRRVTAMAVPLLRSSLEALKKADFSDFTGSSEILSRFIADNFV